MRWECRDLACLQCQVPPEAVKPTPWQQLMTDCERSTEAMWRERGAPEVLTPCHVCPWKMRAEEGPLRPDEVADSTLIPPSGRKVKSCRPSLNEQNKGAVLGETDSIWPEDPREA